MADRDSTRSSLLNTAIQLFGEHGYASVSTRMLADKAGVNIAAIKYHFGSKDDLYIGAIDAIVDEVKPRLDTVKELARHAKVLAGDNPEKQALVMTQFIDTVLSAFLTSSLLQSAIPFVIRELFVPGPHFERLYDAVPRRLHELLTDLVAWILKLSADREAVIIRTHAVIGQIIIYHIGRPILVNRLGVAAYSEKHIADIKQQATTSILASLGLPHD